MNRAELIEKKEKIISSIIRFESLKQYEYAKYCRDQLKEIEIKISQSETILTINSFHLLKLKKPCQ